MRLLSHFRFLPILLLCLALLPACRTEPAPQRPATLPKAVKFSGPTMGTQYNISYIDSLERPMQAAVDSILNAINLEVSTYIDSSTIVRFNRSENDFAIHSAGHFAQNFYKARQVWEQSAGAFDPTVMPLVQYWGFGTEKRPVRNVDSLRVDSLRAFVGLEKITFEDDGSTPMLRKADARTQLDFSGVAKGYAIDQIGAFLTEKGMENFMIEIGGEVLARGKNAQGEWWTIGVNTPARDAQVTDFQAIVDLRDQALATSGNYRNYYEVAGRKYGHTINPTSGFPEQSSLLSASVFAADCATADAWATAFMVMGLEKAYALASQLDEVEALFIFGDESGAFATKASPGFRDRLKN